MKANGTAGPAIATVGVVMPAFNAAKTIEVAVRSVLDQTWPHLELIVCDDGSTDGTLAVLARIDDPRLTVLTTEANQGPGAARDRAIAATSADWIAVIDADDAWMPDRIEALMAATQGQRNAMVFDDIMQCHDTPAGLVPWRPLRGHRAFGRRSKESADLALEELLVARRLLIKPMFPAEAVRAHSIEHSRRIFGEDIEFFLRLAATGLQLRYLPEPLYLYRITPGSATAVARNRSLMRQCLEECMTLPGLPAVACQALAVKTRNLAEDEALYSLRDLLRHGHFIRFARRLGSRPRLLFAGARRALSAFRYEIDRMRHGGRRR